MVNFSSTIWNSLRNVRRSGKTRGLVKYFVTNIYKKIKPFRSMKGIFKLQENIHALIHSLSLSTPVSVRTLWKGYPDQNLNLTSLRITGDFFRLPQPRTVLWCCRLASFASLSTRLPCWQLCIDGEFHNKIATDVWVQTEIFLLYMQGIRVTLLPD